MALEVLFHYVGGSLYDSGPRCSQIQYMQAPAPAQQTAFQPQGAPPPPMSGPPMPSMAPPMSAAPPAVEAAIDGVEVRRAV